MRDFEEANSAGHLSPEEAREALASLTTAERVKLDLLARRRAGGLPTLTWEDLLSEAFGRILAGTRLWPRNVRPVTFIANVVRSIASEERDRLERIPEIVESDLGGAEDSEETFLSNVSADDPRASQPERTLSSEETIQQIENMFANDTHALAIILGRAEGWTPAETRREFDISEIEYGTATKRIWRALLKSGLERP